jgi:hypothetical protein
MLATTIVIIDETYNPNVVVTTNVSLKPHKQEGDPSFAIAKNI